MDTSKSIAETYLWYADTDNLQGAQFNLRDDDLIIHQETDEDEESTKYVVIRAEVFESTWESLVEMVKRSKQ